MPSSSETAEFRRSFYLILTVVAVAIAAAKVIGAENVVEPSRYKAAPGGYGLEQQRLWPTERPDPTPMFSSNDKSRWATVRALVEEQSYVIGKRTYPDAHNLKSFKDSGIIAEPQYKSLDIVMRPVAADSQGPASTEFYSSKPPLFATLLAGEYWVLHKFLGWSIVADRWLVIPTILLTVNVIPFAIYLYLLGNLLENLASSQFATLLAFSAAAFGTFLTTFSGTLNNHIPAAFCILFASYPVLRAAIENREMTTAGYLASGFFAGFATTFDLPVAAFLAALGLPFLIARPRQSVFFFIPAAAIPIASLFLCNYAAMGTLRLPYSEFGGPWYTFEGSHWAKLALPPGHPDRTGIDFANEPKDVYAFHLLVGHHGWFSLTPIWLVAAIGLLALVPRSVIDARKLFGAKGFPWTLPIFAAMTLVLFVVLVLFYVDRTNNYGGNTSGPRWLFWFTPLWLLAIPRGADYLTRSRLGRFFAVLLLGISVFSVFYPAWNPWRSPWAMQLMEFEGWGRY